MPQETDFDPRLCKKLRREVEITYKRTVQAMTGSVEVPTRWQAVECSDESSPDCGCIDDAGRVDRSRCCYPEH